MKYISIVTLCLLMSACSGDEADEKVNSFLDKPLQGTVSQYGLYRMVRSGGVVEDDKTTTGKVVSNPVIQQVSATKRIPLIKGAQMYLQYKLWPLPDQPAYVDLRRVLVHPEMTLPDGTVSTGSDFEVKRKVSSNHVIVYTGYGFDEDYELVEGDWVFQIWYKNKKMIEHKFTTFWPDEKEIAALKPRLELGNQVLSRMQSPDYAKPYLNWPRVLASGDKGDAPPGVKEVIKSMDKPMITP